MAVGDGLVDMYKTRNLEEEMVDHSVLVVQSAAGLALD